MDNPANVPLNRVKALQIVDDLFAAITVLSDESSVDIDSTDKLIDCADELLDYLHDIGGGVWLHRTTVIAIASTILDHGYIPIYEHTLHQPLALQLLDHHDHLLDLVSQWP